MHIDAAVLRRMDKFAGKYLSVGDDYRKVCIERLKKLFCFVCFQCFRLIYGDIIFECKLFDGRRSQNAVASFGLVRLSEHSADIVSVVYKCLKARNGKIRSAHKNYSHKFSLCSIGSASL